MNLNELGSFLRARREALRPAEVGLTDQGVRRTPGLRREEVAMLAGMSVVRYGRLERGSGAELTGETVAELGGGRPSNISWGWFTDPRVAAMVDPRHHDAISQACISQLRTAAGWAGDHHPGTRLIADLTRASAQFARLWATTPMTPFKPIRVTVNHPVAGPLDISIEMVLSPSARHRVVMMRPEPGTATWQHLKELRSRIER